MKSGREQDPVALDPAAAAELELDAGAAVGRPPRPAPAVRRRHHVAQAPDQRPVRDPTLQLARDLGRHRAPPPLARDHSAPLVAAPSSRANSRQPSGPIHRESASNSWIRASWRARRVTAPGRRSASQRASWNAESPPPSTTGRDYASASAIRKPRLEHVADRSAGARSASAQAGHKRLVGGSDREHDAARGEVSGGGLDPQASSPARDRSRALRRVPTPMRRPRRSVTASQ